MKILSIHADFLEFKPEKKASPEAEEIKKEKRKIKECLVIFTAVEKRDEKNSSQIIKKYVQEIENIAKQVKVKKIVLYPYAHLSSQLASGKKALEIMKTAERDLAQRYEVIRAPFGWYKSFEIKCKGHPLSELSREITFKEETLEKANIERVESSEVKKERKKGAEFKWFFLVDKEGKEYPLDPKNWKKNPLWEKKEIAYKRLYLFVRNELERGAKEKSIPKHISYMKRLELVDYCPEADVGHMKWHPKGLLIKDLILAYQEKLARGYGAFKIQNPLIYRLSVPEIKKLIGEFQERDYSWLEGRERLILRFASDPGAFPYMQKLNFSYKNLPLKEYEEAICFRKEQKGEVKGLRRVRNFLMTDLHCFCKDMKQLKEEYLKLCNICKKLMDGIITKGRWVLGWEGTIDFYKKNQKWLLGIVKELEVPSFFKLSERRNHYYEMKNEFQSIEADEGNTQISTVQIDLINGKRFGINYIDQEGKKNPCLIIHCSTFGSVERTFCALLENAALDEKEGKKPMLPLWLSPTQVRLCPISSEYLSFAEKLKEEIEQEKIRVDIDDRSESVAKKIRDAEKEWVPLIIVLGEEETKGGKLKVRIREENKIEQLTKEELIKKVKKETKDKPYKPLPLSVRLSQRPIFGG